MHVIDLDETDASAAVLARQDGGEGARWERHEDSGLFRILKSKAKSGKFSRRGGIVLPVVVRDQKGAIAIVKLQSRIGQHGTEAELGQRRANSAYYHSRVVVVAPKNKPSDHDIGSCQDKTAGADVGQLRVGRLVGVIDFHQTYAGAAVLPCQDGSIRSIGRERGDDA